MAESPQMPESAVESNYPRLTKRQLAILSMTEEEQVRTARLMWASSLFLAFIPGLFLMRRFEKGTILHYHGTCSVVSWVSFFVVGGVTLALYRVFPSDYRFLLSGAVAVSTGNTLGGSIFESLSMKTYSRLCDRSSVATPFTRWITYKVSGKGKEPEIAESKV